MVWTIRAFAATLTAVAMVTVAAAPADARRISERTIRKECRDANGGTYRTEVVKDGLGRNNRFSSCTYHDGANWYTDNYMNGEYDGTIDW